jgi:hypothetical protein
VSCNAILYMGSVCHILAKIVITIQKKNVIEFKVYNIYDKERDGRLQLLMSCNWSRKDGILILFSRNWSILESTPYLKMRVSANILLALHKALDRSVTTYACPAWELVTDTCFLKLQRLQGKVLCTTGKFPWCTPVRDLHTAFNLPYVYDYITKFFRRQAEVIQNHENEHVRNIWQGEARPKKCKRLELGGGQFTTVQVTICRCSIRSVSYAWSALQSLYWPRTCI